MKSEIFNFTDLEVWQSSRSLVSFIYKITRLFPQEELFSLVSQMRRCSISIISNIAEGFSRLSPKDKMYFYRVALGSLTELQSQLFISSDLNYLPSKKFEEIILKITSVHKMLHKLISSIRRRSLKS